VDQYRVPDIPPGATAFTVELCTDTIRPSLRLRGELDIATAGRLRDALRGLIRGGHQGVVLDLAQLDFLGGAGLEVLAWAAAALDRLGGKIIIINATSIARRALAITGLDHTLVVE
jgi:anti-sigma B factor antagonist